ncbi:MAG: sterol desaturase family protein [Rhodocyclaceae bacterium]|nr:sterol desaturase family protein [Rhodocyclaceae bacterium]
MNPIIYAIPVFMLTVLIEAGLARRRGLAVYDIPDALTSLHHGVISEVTGVLWKLAGLGTYALVYTNFHATELPADSWLIFVLALLAYDFCYYWQHRMGHEMNVLWAAHVVHHSSEYYNLATALRQTSTGRFFGWVFYLPMAVIGVPPTLFFTVAVIDLLYQYWVHTELIGRLGWLDRVFVTPSNHRVHHGQNDYCIDKNYGGILILWDRLFGTFADEREGEKIIYGIRKPLQSFNPVWGNLHYYNDLWRESVQAVGWRAKLGVWLAPPGGWTDAPLAHFDTATFVNYDCKTSSAMRWYAAIQYTLVVPCVVQILAMDVKAAPLLAVLYVLLIIATTVCVGLLLEGRQIAQRFEMLRLLLIGIAFVTMPDWFGFDAPVILRVALAMFSLASLVWLAQQRIERSPVGAGNTL